MLKSFHLDVTLQKHVFKSDKNSRTKSLQNQAFITSNHSLQIVNSYFLLDCKIGKFGCYFYLHIRCYEK